ncbi:MAG TPA: amidohydrolase family protein [Acidimicrobiales bacterium]|nr:amidohydrolase family protein [Acidimicrobiales bacterium]
MPATSTELLFIDADGHILEHPSGFRDYAPAAFAERVWHIDTDDQGREWAVMDGQRNPANYMALAGTAGMSAEDRDRAQRGELRYTEVRPAAWDAPSRLIDMDADQISQSVLYPTLLLGIQGHGDVEFARVMCRTYNDWLSDHVGQGQGRLFGVAALPQQDIAAAADEIRRVAAKPGIVGVFLRPNPSEGWRHFHDPVYDPLWTAASDTGLAVGLHPFLTADLPGACQGMRINKLRTSSSPMPADAGPAAIDNIFFTQAIANPFDMMSSMAFLLAGGVCERFPELRLVFLEAGGGWLVPWLERLDHHYEIFGWDVPQLRAEPSEYFRRQCWISFDPDESTLAFTASSPLCGADRIVWASDYPHPDATYPGVTGELRRAVASLSPEQQRRITADNAAALYGL